MIKVQIWSDLRRVAKMPFYVLILLIVVCISINGAIARPVSDSTARIVFHFPAAYSVGSLLLYPDRSGFKSQDFHDARGDVAIPARAGIGLTLTYAGANDTSYLRNLDAPYLVSLDLNRLAVDDAQAKDLKNFVSLRSLNIESSDIGDPGMQYFRDMKELRSLDISRTMITGRSFSLLPRFPKLQRLNASHNNLDDGSTAYLEALQDLDNLRLGSCGFSDQALVHIGKLTKLKSLHLEANAKITDAGIAHLINLKALRYLDISETQVTTACAKYLQPLTNLSDLYLSLSKLKHHEVEAFHKAVPNCQIHDVRKPDHNTAVELFAPLHSPIAPQHARLPK